MSNNELDLSSIKNTLTIANAMEEISKLEDNTNVANRTENLVKWKSHVNQVVIETGEYFYKIYEASEMGDSTFTQLVRNRLAAIYEDLGIHWKVVTFEKDNKIYNFQQRQKLKVATKQDGDFASIFLSFSYLLDQVEEELGFNEILRQVKANPAFSKVAKLKLVRTTVNKYDDYAIYNNQAILLDDAEFCIALVDNQGHQLEVSAKNEIEISMPYGNFLFCNLAATRIEDAKTLKHSLKIDHEREKIFKAWYLDATKSKKTSKKEFSDGTFGHHYNSYRMGKSIIAQYQQKEISMNIETADQAQQRQNRLAGAPNNAKLLTSKTKPSKRNEPIAPKTKKNETLYLQFPEIEHASNACAQLNDFKNINKQVEDIDPCKHNTVCLTGEKFFQSQIKNTDILNEFVNLIKIIAILLVNKKINRITISTNLTNGLQANLYKALDTLENVCNDMCAIDATTTVVLVSNLNSLAEEISSESLKNWKVHMQNINAYYPWVEKETLITVDKHFVELYLDNKFSTEQLLNTLGTSFLYQLPSKQQLFVKRAKFRKFLIKYARKDPASFMKLLNISLFSATLQEETKQRTTNLPTDEINPTCLLGVNTLKHSKAFALYQDCDCCVACDIKQVWESVVQGTPQNNREQKG